MCRNSPNSIATNLALLPTGWDLNTDQGIPNIPGLGDGDGGEPGSGGGLPGVPGSGEG